jgi:hypothetical protein
MTNGRKPVWLLRRTILGDVPFGRLALRDTINGVIVAVTETPTETVIVIKED